MIAYGKARATPCGVALLPNRRSGWGGDVRALWGKMPRLSNHKRYPRILLRTRRTGNATVRRFSVGGSCREFQTPTFPSETEFRRPTATTSLSGKVGVWNSPAPHGRRRPQPQGPRDRGGRETPPYAEPAEQQSHRGAGLIPDLSGTAVAYPYEVDKLVNPDGSAFPSTPLAATPTASTSS